MAASEKIDDLCRRDELECLDALAGQEDRPEAMRPFDLYFRERQRAGELADIQVPVVGQFCDFVPDELTLAAGAIPLRLDTGCHPLVRAGEKRMPQDICCAVRASAGASLEGSWMMSAADLVVVPTACDGKKKLASVLAANHEVHVLELPQFNRGERSLAWWRAEVRRLVKRLQKLTGRSLTRRPLRDAVILINRRAELVRRMNELRAGPVPPIQGGDAFLLMQAALTCDPGWWVEKTESLVEELEQRVRSGRGTKPKARLLLTGSPILFPDYKLLILAHACGADVVADEMCSGTQRLYHPNTVDEWTQGGIIEAAAERVLLPCTCPCFVAEEGRKDRLLDLCERFRVDGIVHHTLRLCQPYDADTGELQALFQQRKMPWIEIHSEFGPEASARMRNRLEAFVEMITGEL